MAFDTKDTSQQVQLQQDVTVEEVIFRRNRALPGVPLEIIVVKRKVEDGQQEQLAYRVPASIVDNNWPGTARTLQQHLFSIIDAAV